LGRIVEIEPKRISAYINRANIYEKMAQLDRAISDYDTLINLNPGDNYYVERKAGVAAKLAARGGRPAPAAEPVVPPPAVAPTTQPPGAAAPTEPQKEATKTPTGPRECRRFDAIANTTISVPCPE